MTERKVFVFLDVDGVLNKKCHWNRLFYLDDSCIMAFAEYLSKITILENVCIVLTSTWKNGYQRNKRHSKVITDLEKRLSKHGLRIIDKTETDIKGDRAKEINDYVVQHELQDYKCIVIDDDSSLFKTKLISNCRFIQIDSDEGFVGFVCKLKKKGWFYELFNVAR